MASTTYIQAAGEGRVTLGSLTVYFVLGVLFGILLTKAEVISWFRIQEMFRFQSFHMLGILGAAVITAALSIRIIKRLQVKSLSGEEIDVPPKQLGRGIRYIAGGTLFGLGWALTGACPGPIVVLVGNGVTAMLVVLGSALAGTWTYGALRPKLPH